MLIPSLSSFNGCGNVLFGAFTCILWRWCPTVQCVYGREEKKVVIVIFNCTHTYTHQRIHPNEDIHLNLHVGKIVHNHDLFGNFKDTQRAIKHNIQLVYAAVSEVMVAAAMLMADFFDSISHYLTRFSV